MFIGHKTYTHENKIKLKNKSLVKNLYNQDGAFDIDKGKERT